MIVVKKPSGGGSPGGSDTQVQYNDSGSFAGNADFTYDSTDGILTVNSKDSAEPGLIVEGASSTGPIATFQRSGGSRTIEMSALTSSIMGFFVNGHAAFGGTALNENSVIVAGKNVSNPTAAQTGTNLSLTFRVTSGANAQRVTGGQFNISMFDSNNITNDVRGGYFTVQNSNTATVTKPRGGEFLLYNTSSGTITTGQAGLGVVQNLNASGVIESARVFEAKLGFNYGTITNMYGFYCGDVTGTGTHTNTPYSFYASDGDAFNFFAGEVGIGGGATAPTAALDIDSDVIRLRDSKTPSSASDTGNAGDIAWDSDFIYVCVAANTWKRTAISTW